MEKRKYYIFDETGDTYEIDGDTNLNAMIKELMDDDLEILYKSTRYFHELELAKLELIDMGLMTQEGGDAYDAEGVILAADAFAREIASRLGNDVLEMLDSEVDVTWKQNKPDLSKYKK